MTNFFCAPKCNGICTLLHLSNTQFVAVQCSGPAGIYLDGKSSVCGEGEIVSSRQLRSEVLQFNDKSDAYSSAFSRAAKNAKPQKSGNTAVKETKHEKKSSSLQQNSA